MLSTVKCFVVYKSIGGLFHEATDGVIQLYVTECIWGILQELVRIIAETFEINEERAFDALINRSEAFKHYLYFDRLKIAKGP
jgi:hypothetical protein